MHHKKILKKIIQVEKEYTSLRNELKNHSIFKSENNLYTKKNKESLIILWKKYIVFFDKLQKLIRASYYRRYLFVINYNKFLLRKYLLHLYFTIIQDLVSDFGQHEKFIRVFLDENFIKDYGVYAKYIYKPKYLNLINTPKIFIKPFSSLIDANILKLLDNIKEFKNTDRIRADYNNIFFYLKYRLDKIIFLISKHIGYLISHTKFSTRKNGLITKENIEKYLEIAIPGDILLSRGNWNASNIPIPGFWKHMAMYIGDGKYLKDNFIFSGVQELDDNSHYIIEATGKGINIVDIYDFAYFIDYLGVGRTTFMQEKIKRSLQNAFLNLGKGYDFILNYYSDKRLVCSALVLKSYAKEFDNDQGIDINLEEIGISLTYPPNSFINKLNEDNNLDNPQVKPTFFIDSLEKTGRNFINTNEELLKTNKRPKLSIFLS